MNARSEYCDIQKCCVVQWLRGAGGKNALLQHLQNFIQSNYLDPICWDLKEEIVDDSGPVAHSVIDSSPSTFENSNSSKISTGCLKEGLPILYGAGSQISEGVQRLYICDKMSLTKLETFLDLLHVTYDGIASPYVYAFGTHLKLAWHIEDAASLNLKGIPHASSRLWFIIPEENVIIFEEVMTRILNLSITRQNFINLLGHSDPVVEILPENIKIIPVFMILQDNIESRVLCPPSGYCSGQIVVEAAKYVREVRIPKLISSCRCARIQIDEVDWNEYPDIASVLSLLQKSTTSHQTEVVNDPSETNIRVKGGISTEHQKQIPFGEEDVQENQEKTGKACQIKCNPSSHASDSDEAHEMCTCVGSVLLQCPACSIAFKGGEDRVDRLLNHAMQSHNDLGIAVVQRIRKLYPIRPCPLNPKNRQPNSLLRMASSCSLFSCKRSSSSNPTYKAGTSKRKRDK